jgi:hypothetical protein
MNGWKLTNNGENSETVYWSVGWWASVVAIELTGRSRGMETVCLQEETEEE